jgi:hypothetical protein
MTSLKEKISVMQHHDNGGKVELFSRNTLDWRSNAHPLWNWDAFDYRKKPEPEYVPFTTSDIEDILGKDVFSRGKITGVASNGVLFYTPLGYNHETFDELFRKFKFADGSTCGKIKQQL